jgi:uncharacterized membrane protein
MSDTRDSPEAAAPSGAATRATVQAAGASLGRRLDALKAATPGLVAGARARLADGVDRLRKVDVRAMPLDRAALGAKVEQWIKPRAAPDPGTVAPSTSPAPAVDPATGRSTAIAATAPTQNRQARATVRGTPTERVRQTMRRPFVTLGMLLTAVVLGGILHLLTVFAVIALGTGSAYDRLRFQLEANTMKVLPVDPTGAMPLPFLSPDMRYAMCRFDLSAGPLAVSAQLPEVGWSLALYTPQGDNFYIAPGQEGRNVDATFTLNTASDRVLIPVPGQRRADVDAAQVSSPVREGLLVIRGPMKGASYLPIVERTLAAARCQTITRR